MSDSPRELAYDPPLSEIEAAVLADGGRQAVGPSLHRLLLALRPVRGLAEAAAEEPLRAAHRGPYTPKELARDTVASA